MNWGSIVGPLAKAGLSGIGAAIGGPFGSAIGGILGDAAAAALGTDATPEAVADAIEADPAGAAEKLAGLEAQAVAMAEVEAKMMAEVNATMRAEIAGCGVQRFWRPAAGWVFAVSNAGYCVLFVWSGVVMLLYHDMASFTAMVNSVGAWLTLQTPLGAVVGVTAWTRGREKEAALTGSSPPSIIGNLAQAVARKAGR